MGLYKVDSKGAKASFPTDEKKVKDLIKASIGFNAVDTRVKKAIIQWVAQVVSTYMEGLVLVDGDINHEAKIEQEDVDVVVPLTRADDTDDVDMTHELASILPGMPSSG